MKVLIFTFLFVSQLANAVSEEAFIVSRRVHDYQCSEKGIQHYSYEKTFSELFSYEYLNEDMKKFAGMFKAVDKQMKDACKNKGYFSFEVQSCYHRCQSDFNVSSKNFTLCTATCTSILTRSRNLHEHALQIELDRQKMEKDHYPSARD